MAMKSKIRQMPLLFGLLLCLLLSGCGASKEIQDGTYRVDCTLSGGSGRASIEEAVIEIAGEEKTATIVWSSPYYEYMLVDEVRYEPVQEEGNATFVIPAVLDQEMPVSASTVAMSQPHLIEYTLYFDSKTLEEIEP